MPEATWALARKRAAPIAVGQQISLINAMHIKRDLTASLAPEAAFSQFCALMGLDKDHALRRMPLVDLGDALANSSDPVTVLNEGGEPRSNRTATIYGPGAVPAIENTGRRVLAGWLSDVTVYGRSALTRQGDTLLLDARPEERTAFPMDMTFDPVVFQRTGDAEVGFIEDTGPKRCLEVPAAISLLGINSVSFGHWMQEQLPQFLAARKLLGNAFLGPDASPLPVLVDDGMPAQHLQSLAFFGRSGGPEIVRVPRGYRVKVERLFRVQDWLYCPHLITTDTGLDVAKTGAVMEGLGEIYRFGGDFAGRRITGSQIPAPPRVATTRRLFWARKPIRHRSIENWKHVARCLDDLGYTVCFPEEMTFPRQVAAIRAADRIVVQNGSASIGLLLAKPETRLLYLSHPDLSRFAIQVEAHAQTGVDVRVLSGDFAAKGDTWIDQSNYRIDLATAEPAFDWLEEGMAPAPVKPPKALFATPNPAETVVPETDTVLPPDLNAKLEQIGAEARQTGQLDLWKGLTLKSGLSAHCPPVEAQHRYARLIGAQNRIWMQEHPICGLLDRLKAEGQDLAMLDAPETETTLRVPHLVGPGTALELTRVPRAVAGGWLDAAQVFAQSGTILHEGALLIDRQGDEADRVPQELGSDAVLFGPGAQPQSAVFIDENRPEKQLHLSSAWSLMSQNSRAFGHWTFETLTAFLTWHDRPDLEGVPILIDADMPPQHRESLDLLAAGRFPIIPVDPGSRVFVSRLFAATGWQYTPHLMTGDPLRSADGLTDFNVFGYNVAKVAGLFRAAGARLDRRCPALPQAATHLYLTRDADQHRQLANAPAIAEMLTERGFDAYLPNDKTFAAQIGALRAAQQIVCQAGSASHLAFFARPGTRMCLMHHPGTRTMAIVTSLMQAIGVDVTLAVGPFEITNAKKAGYSDRASYAVPPARVSAILDGWAEQPASGPTAVLQKPKA